MSYIPRCCFPEIDALTQRNGQCIVTSPTDEVEVIIIDQVRSIEDTGRCFGNPSPDGFVDGAETILRHEERIYSVVSPGGPAAIMRVVAVVVGCGGAMEDVELIEGKGVNDRWLCVHH